MGYLRKVDVAAFSPIGPGGRLRQILLDPGSGGQEGTILYMQDPPGSNATGDGHHIHSFEQIFYILSGVMDLEIRDQQHQARPGTLVVLPPGTPHRNWNGSSEPLVLLSMWVPSPKQGEAIAIPTQEANTKHRANFEYMRTVDPAAFNTGMAQGRLHQPLLNADSGARGCTIGFYRLEPEDASTAQSHTHPVEQIFYVLDGVMCLEIAGEPYQAGPDTPVVIPPGVVHRNWNGGTGLETHLTFWAPIPRPAEPAARP